jgi:hypothetical protein
MQLTDEIQITFTVHLLQYAKSQNVQSFQIPLDLSKSRNYKTVQQRYGLCESN